MVPFFYQRRFALASALNKKPLTRLGLLEGMIQPPKSIPPAITPLEERTLFAQRRAAIDVVATTRATIIRCGLFGSYLFRPNPLREDTAETRQSWIDEMWLQFNHLNRAAQMVAGRDPNEEFADQICTWLAHCADRKLNETGALQDMVRMTRTMIEAVPAGGHTFEKLLIDHAVYGRRSFFPAISILCDSFWADLDLQRHNEVMRAQETGDTIGTTLSRLEHIGRHVRLVSLNASVEAARVGDAGKGLGVIAQEFKSLAEEIQHLANHARADIDGIRQSEI